MKNKNKHEEKYHSYGEIKAKFFPKTTKIPKKIEEESEVVGVHLANEFLEGFKKKLSKLNL